MDISLPDWDGVKLAGEIRKILPKAIILMVSVHTDSSYIAESFKAGASGYLFKESLPETLLAALDVVSKGEHFMQGPISVQEVERLKNLAPNHQRDDMSRYESLTRRQQEVMRLIVQGLSCKTIGERLSLSTGTVENHRARIMDRLGLSNITELVRFAAGLNLTNEDL